MGLVAGTKKWWFWRKERRWWARILKDYEGGLARVEAALAEFAEDRGFEPFPS